MMTNLIAIIIIILVLTVITMSFLPSINPEVNGSKNKCLVGKNHDDNNPSKKKAKELIESGAGVCEVAKKCDSMEIDVSIKDKKELHQTDMYKTATDKQKEELDESAEHGHGHDNPNLKCYEVQYSVEEEK